MESFSMIRQHILNHKTIINENFNEKNGCSFFAGPVD